MNVDRRGFAAAAGLAGTAAVVQADPPALPADGPPGLPCGVASGDVTHDSAVVWSRCDRPARMLVEFDTTPDFRKPRRAEPAAATAEADFTAKAVLSGLSAGATVHYRVWFDAGGKLSPSAAGRFRTAPPPGRPADVFFAWSGDTAGQGFGIDPARGGYRSYDAVRRLAPDFFVHCGDHIYADNPMPERIPLADGTVWANVVTAAKSRPAASLDDFRGNYRYNLLDEHVRRFNAEVAQVVQWDDHETTNNWYPDQVLAGRPDAAGYRGVPDGRALAARARQAFFEYLPIRPSAADRDRIYRSAAYGTSCELFVLDQRSYRGPNTANRQETAGPETAFLGAGQLAWLKRGLRASRATWKVICSDMPIGLVVPDGKARHEGPANADGGPPLGRELEFADLFADLHAGGVKNVVWLTADVHYAAAHHYSPARAGFRGAFEPFWEFVAGPMHAGTFGPNKLDGTFGPEVRFEWAPRAGLVLPTGRRLAAGFKLPLAPSDGMQSFGTVRIDGRTQRLTVEFRDGSGEPIHDGTRAGRFELEPAS